MNQMFNSKAFRNMLQYWDFWYEIHLPSGNPYYVSLQVFTTIN
jgi:hypothetical protein